MKLTAIGDPHGKIQQYYNIINKCEKSFCVGDFGFKKEWDWLTDNVSTDHLTNPGNHDYGPYVNSHSHSTGNHKFFPEYNLFTVRGADSIDRIYRVENRDWWANEELNYQEQIDAYDSYILHKPKIVISHDCPQSIMEHLFPYNSKSQTRVMLQHMFEEHKPELWIFGHHHQFKDVTILGTRFICLEELQTFTIKV